LERSSVKGAVPWEFIVMVAIVDQLSISVLEIIATEEEEWLLREATDAVTKLGGGDDLPEAWVDRLADEHLYGVALDSCKPSL
jgi:hypothetical protein